MPHSSCTRGMSYNNYWYEYQRQNRETTMTCGRIELRVRREILQLRVTSSDDRCDAVKTAEHSTNSARIPFLASSRENDEKKTRPKQMRNE